MVGEKLAEKVKYKIKRRQFIIVDANGNRHQINDENTLKYQPLHLMAFLQPMGSFKLKRKRKNYAVC